MKTTVPNNTIISKLLNYTKAKKKPLKVYFFMYNVIKNLTDSK